LNIRWSPAAYAALQSQVERLNELSPGAGDRLAESIRERIAQLTDFAMSGRVVPEYDAVGLREVIVRRYRVFYRLEAGGVEVVTLFHGAMNLDSGD
jgi:plasmid stabilization system protein ParE